MCYLEKFGRVFLVVNSSFNASRILSPYAIMIRIAGILDSKFLVSGTWIHGFQSLAGFRIPRAVFRIPKPRIPEFTSKDFPDFEKSELPCTMGRKLLNKEYK